MSTKLLTLLLNGGTYLAIIPPLKKQNLCVYKFYVFAMSAFIITGVIITSYIQNFYSDFVLIKQVVWLVEDTFLISLNLYVVNILGLRKRKQWKDLIECLKATENLIFVKLNKRKFPYYLEFIIANLVHFSLATYEYIFWARSVGILFLKQHFIRYLQMYLNFYCIFLLCVVTNMILARYKGLKAIIMTQCKSHTHLNNNSVLNFTSKIEKNMFFLKKTVDVYNTMFGWTLFLIISLTTVQILNYIDHIIYYTEDQSSQVQVVLLSIAIVTWIFLGALVLILLCSFVEQEAEEIVRISYDIRLRLAGNLNLQCYKMQEFTNFLIKNLPKFTAANFFYIERSTILSILGTVSTFLIILIQFRKQ
ncbi:uncharacterized protein LOC123005621 [Tribolium madens]|uniref:uncharacterized protein LOC123005621 n=1 Tax=Tribolium madens TaxID=41895 RepID=UPI001CF72C4F|nr:uncharacterized protein LOC123005621 [Tribolium madens]